MARAVGWTKRILLAGAVIVSLGIGARQAFGSATKRLECNPPPTSIGQCTSDTQCQSMCDAVYGVGATLGDCSVSPEMNPGCCFCFQP